MCCLLCLSHTPLLHLTHLTPTTTTLAHTPIHLQVERALLDLCLDPSDSFLAAVAVDMGSSLSEGSVSSSVRLYEVRVGVWVCVCAHLLVCCCPGERTLLDWRRCENEASTLGVGVRVAQRDAVFMCVHVCVLPLQVGRQRPAEDDDDESDGGGEDEEDEESDESDGGEGERHRGNNGVRQGWQAGTHYCQILMIAAGRGQCGLW